MNYEQVRRYEQDKLPEGAVLDEQTIGRLTGVFQLDTHVELAHIVNNIGTDT